MRKLLTLFITIYLSFSVNAEKLPCEQHPDVIEACFDIDGKLGFYNGSPSVRITLKGDRVLGVSEGRFYIKGYDNLPANILKGLTFDTALEGNFKVCPFTEDKPKVMRLVCVQSYKHTKLVNRE